MDRGLDRKNGVEGANKGRAYLCAAVPIGADDRVPFTISHKGQNIEVRELEERQHQPVLCYQEFDPSINPAIPDVTL